MRTTFLRRLVYYRRLLSLLVSVLILMPVL
nr:MAG TPA: hypothetical protein [Caudoviricetes sp.]